ncbi:MAG: GntR family transcriptional regulator [Anaerolineae bacterium]|nr:GntR family transcriptional regulator [Anaerolineae bacterium]
MTLQPIEGSKRTIAAMVQERIRAAILSGDLPAGSRLEQARLAEELNVSLVPVREALNKLEGEGFVQIIPRRGAFVTQTSIRDMEDLYFARRILEGEAAFHAAEHLTASDLHTLENSVEDMNRALAKQDYPAFMESNRHFHYTIYEASGSHYLMDSIKLLWDLAERYRYRYVFVRDHAEVTQAEHRIILAACRQRDAIKLRDAIILHMNRTLEGIKGYLLEQPTAEQVKKR